MIMCSAEIHVILDMFFFYVRKEQNHCIRIITLSNPQSKVREEAQEIEGTHGKQKKLYRDSHLGAKAFIQASACRQWDRSA